MHECHARPCQHLADDFQGVIAIADEHTVSDPAGPVIGTHHLLAVAQFRRIEVRGAIALAWISVDEDWPAFGVGATRAGRRVGDQQDAVARTGFAEAAAQRVAAFGDGLWSQPVARLIQSGHPDLLQFAGRDRLEVERAGDRIGEHAIQHGKPVTAKLAGIGRHGPVSLGPATRAGAELVVL